LWSGIVFSRLTTRETHLECEFGHALSVATSSSSPPRQISQFEPSNPASGDAARWQIPATDDGLPGTGPIRRYNWFRKLWSERRAKWAAGAEKQQGALVLLGDSITQGWGDDFTAYFPGIKVANRASAETPRAAY
jgi:hypothetical protein